MSPISARLVNPPSVRLLLALGLGRAIPWLRRARGVFHRRALDSSGHVPGWRYRRWIARHEPAANSVEVTQSIAVLPLERIGEATTDWVALCEPRDRLAPSALAEMSREIAVSPDADLFYSAEDEIDDRGRRSRPQFKPDWSPDYLRSCNYIGGLLVVRRELLQRLGPVSSDYDLTLRGSEIARRIVQDRKSVV